MSHGFVIHRHGGPDVMNWQELPVGEPGPGQLRLRQSAVGVNFIDVYHRTGLYKPVPLPFVPGSEGVGVVESVGPGVTDVREGDRVAYAGPLGAYAQTRLLPADRAVVLPDAIDDVTAAAMMLKGMTAQYLLCQTTTIQPGDRILWHAAAGGVGLLACQWARHLGATVIGTAGSEDKAALARAHGCDHVIVYTRENFVERVRELTDGQGVRAVFDSVGRDTFAGSLECLRPRGLMVSFGQSSGSVPPFEVTTLMSRGSLFLTRPTLAHYTATPATLRATAQALFDVVASGAVTVPVGRRRPLQQAPEAHADLESRRTTGASVLTVEA